MRRRPMSHVPRHCEEHDQDSENNPDVEAHREEPLNLYSPPGNDLTYRFPLIVDTLLGGHAATSFTLVYATSLFLSRT